ncbi:uncharacterized protein LOC132744213 isoform X3 [Ruditapes philippinarum]|uniref:uncharacterized protein LOC132744213 isoform X3 n=1 Tax=Ruditapes philippinarum TaxID=129788 RepID=UPI00295C182C|nr:uncharacterized protein LOC132744213 isoform X3 [Ruditapes philippinarum]
MVLKFQMMKSDPDICLCNPITDNFTTFEILIQTRNPAFTLRQSRTRRRYNDFCWLKKKLKKNHPMWLFHLSGTPLSKCPALPEKKKFSDRFEIQFLVQRMKELEDWLYRIVGVDLYLSDTTLHLFLQTSLTCEQIDKYMNGNLSELEVQQGYKEAELHLDTYIGTTDDLTSSFRGLSSSVSQENILSDPVHIQSQSRAVLHSTPDRSDSGIAEFESDTESSYDSQGSPYVRSIDSRTSEKYPPLTEVTRDLVNKNPNNDSNTCVSGAVKLSSAADKVAETKPKTSDQAEPQFEYKIKTFVSPDVCGTDVEINVTSKEKIKMGVNENSQEKMSERTKQNVKQESDIRTHMHETESANSSSKPKHKVEMGVLYC